MEQHFALIGSGLHSSDPIQDQMVSQIDMDYYANQFTFCGIARKRRPSKNFDRVNKDVTSFRV